MTVSKSIVRRLQMQSTAPKFREVYAAWFADGVSRNAKPWRPATAKTYKSQIETNVLPVIGDLPVDTVGNTTLKSLVNELKAKGLGAATINRNINNIKDIRSFTVDDDGQPVYPYVWSSKMIDAPEIDKKAQKTPKASVTAIQGGLSCGCASKGTKLLLAVLAGTGMRIQEALAMVKDDEIVPRPYQNRWLSNESKIIVKGQRDGETMGPTKTGAGEREIDLPKELNDFLLKHSTSSCMFPMSEPDYRKELVRCNVIGGFHSLRRFRVTHLKMEGVPDSLIHFWVGHEDSDGVTGRYTEVRTEIEARRAQAQRAGLGFVLPEAV